MAEVGEHGQGPNRLLRRIRSSTSKGGEKWQIVHLLVNSQSLGLSVDTPFLQPLKILTNSLIPSYILELFPQSS
jgi:hypothetical protein